MHWRVFFEIPSSPFILFPSNWVQGMGVLHCTGWDLGFGIGEMAADRLRTDTTRLDASSAACDPVFYPLYLLLHLPPSKHAASRSPFGNDPQPPRSRSARHR